MFGYFNDIVNDGEKHGGRLGDRIQQNDFQDFINYCGFVDVKSHESAFICDLTKETILIVFGKD